MSLARDLLFTVEAARERGFIVRENGDPIAAFSSAAELAAWVENRLAPLDPPAADPEPLPAMLQAVEAMPRRGLARLTGGR